MWNVYIKFYVIITMEKSLIFNIETDITGQITMYNVYKKQSR